MVSSLKPRSQRIWRKFLTIKRLGVLESQTLGETPYEFKLHIIRR